MVTRSRLRKSKVIWVNDKEYIDIKKYNELVKKYRQEMKNER